MSSKKATYHLPTVFAASNDWLFHCISSTYFVTLQRSYSIAYKNNII